MDVFASIARLAEPITSMLSRTPHLSPLNTAVAFAAAIVFLKLMRMSRRGRGVYTPRLGGPPSPSLLYGVGKELLEMEDPALAYESWAHAYGPVFEIPSMFGGHQIVLYDPKAITHFFTKEGWSYGRTTAAKRAIGRLFGKGLFWADGESHRRQRKSLMPAFSIAVIRKLTPIFYESAHKAESAWRALIESSGEESTIIDVQNWMNYVSLDTMGLAAFSHNFGALEGKHASLTVIFDTFSSSPTNSVNYGLALLAQVFPIISRLPTSRTQLFRKLNSVMEEIANTLRARTQKELEMGVVDGEEKSIIGQLIKSEVSDTDLRLSKEEVLSQMKVLLLAGYETTSVSMTWALIELSRNCDIQTKLREELLQHDPDLSYDKLFNGLPYLDGVVHEILRIHSPVPELPRMAIDDDVIPLSQPIRTKSGELIENLPIAKGTLMTIPMASINLSSTIWGDDAKEFKPERWLEENGISAKAKEIQGHRHLLTFSDGPRICLGKNFAVAEFKAVLSVLVRNFVFELRDGPDTKIEIGRGFLPRPMVAGEVGCKVPLRVRPYVG